MEPGEPWRYGRARGLWRVLRPVGFSPRRRSLLQRPVFRFEPVLLAAGASLDFEQSVSDSIPLPVAGLGFRVRARPQDRLHAALEPERSATTGEKPRVGGGVRREQGDQIVDGTRHQSTPAKPRAYQPPPRASV